MLHYVANDIEKQNNIAKGMGEDNKNEQDKTILK